MTERNDDTCTEGEFEIVSFNISPRTGIRKKPVERVVFIKEKGIEGDAHSGLLEKRQVSLLAFEEIEKASATACGKFTDRPDRIGPNPVALVPGDFAENITTCGIALHELPLGTKLEIGSALLEISQIGKECHASCEIRTLIGDCAMPRKGIFARVVRGGEATNADRCYYRI